MRKASEALVVVLISGQYLFFFMIVGRKNFDCHLGLSITLPVFKRILRLLNTERRTLLSTGRGKRKNYESSQTAARVLGPLTTDLLGAF